MKGKPFKPIEPEFWSNLKEGTRLGNVAGETATKRGDDLIWDASKEPVTCARIVLHSWQLIEEKESEMEAEKWERSNAGRYPDCVQYSDTHGYLHGPFAVMERKTFLRWVGKMPNEDEEWPADMWCLWFDEDDEWTYRYNPKEGCINKVFAEYAEMRVEK